MKKKQYILTITLNPVIDKTVKITKFKTGYDFREEEISISAGGKGINVSQVLSHLNIPNIASGFLSKHGSAYIIKQLKEQNISNDFVSINGHIRTSLTIIDPTTIKLTRIMERGPVVTQKDESLLIRKYKKLLKKCFAVVLSGRNIPGASNELYGKLISLAKKEKVFHIFDTSGKPYEIGLQKKPCMIKPNIEEAEFILKKRLRSLSQIKKAAIELYNKGIKIVAITRGSRGVIIFNGKEMIYARPPKIKRKNPIGCGDAFVGGYLAGLKKNKSFQDCVKMAVACGTANALSIDPGTITPLSVYDILKEVKVKYI